MSEYKIQHLADPWWVKDGENDFRRGRLIKAFIPHVEQIPKTLEVTGRKDPTNHNLVNYKIYPLSIRQMQSKPTLPVAALPLFTNEVNIAIKAKVRPAIVISSGGKEVDYKLRKNKPKKNTSQALLVAPCYGVPPDGRAGYTEELIQRIYYCEYPQFIVDTLPLDSNIESLIRLDHIQPVGIHPESIKPTEYSLSDKAMEIIDEWIYWFISGLLDEESTIYEYQTDLKEILSL